MATEDVYVPYDKSNPECNGYREGKMEREAVAEVCQDEAINVNHDNTSRLHSSFDWVELFSCLCK